jgi:hypothetical protein
MHMDWHRGRFTILNRAKGIVEENEASSMLESKVSLPSEWSVWIGRTWGEVFEVLKTWDNKLSEFLENKIYTNKIKSSQAMSNGWNEKERYMLEKDNIMRYIKFMSYWIKTTILLFTFTINKKYTNNRSRGHVSMFYMRTNDKTSTIKISKERIIRGILIQLFKRR